MMSKGRFFVVCLLFIVSSCAHIVPPKVTIVNDNELRFSGKGSGAGMMLSSAMGAMGIAIGFAIDEGIAKDIRKAADNYNFDIDLLLKDYFSQAKVKSRSKQLSVKVERYGFTTWPVGKDGVMPQLHITVSDGIHKPIAIKFPEAFYNRDTDKHVLTGVVVELSDIKKEGKEINRLFDLVVAKVVEHFEVVHVQNVELN